MNCRLWTSPSPEPKQACSNLSWNTGSTGDELPAGHASPGRIWGGRTHEMTDFVRFRSKCTRKTHARGLISRCAGLTQRCQKVHSVLGYRLPAVRRASAVHPPGCAGCLFLPRRVRQALRTTRRNLPAECQRLTCLCARRQQKQNIYQNPCTESLVSMTDAFQGDFLFPPARYRVRLREIGGRAACRRTNRIQESE